MPIKPKKVVAPPKLPSATAAESSARPLSQDNPTAATTPDPSAVAPPPNPGPASSDPSNNENKGSAEMMNSFYKLFEGGYKLISDNYQKSKDKLIDIANQLDKLADRALGTSDRALHDKAPKDSVKSVENIAKRVAVALKTLAGAIDESLNIEAKQEAGSTENSAAGKVKEHQDAPRQGAQAPKPAPESDLKRSQSIRSRIERLVKQGKTPAFINKLGQRLLKRVRQVLSLKNRTEQKQSIDSNAQSRNSNEQNKIQVAQLRQLDEMPVRQARQILQTASLKATLLVPSTQQSQNQARQQQRQTRILTAAVSNNPSGSVAAASHLPKDNPQAHPEVHPESDPKNRATSALVERASQAAINNINAQTIQALATQAQNAIAEGIEQAQVIDAQNNDSAAITMAENTRDAALQKREKNTVEMPQTEALNDTTALGEEPTAPQPEPTPEALNDTAVPGEEPTTPQPEPTPEAPNDTAAPGEEPTAPQPEPTPEALNDTAVPGEEPTAPQPEPTPEAPKDAAAPKEERTATPPLEPPSDTLGTTTVPQHSDEQPLERKEALEPSTPAIEPSSGPTI